MGDIALLHHDGEPAIIKALQLSLNCLPQVLFCFCSPGVRLHQPLPRMYPHLLRALHLDEDAILGNQNHFSKVKLTQELHNIAQDFRRYISHIALP